MLEGWLSYYTKEHAKITSAGLEAGKLNLVAAKAMMEAVIDITKHKTQSIEDIKAQKFDYVITLTDAAQEKATQFFPESKIVHHPVSQPLNNNDQDMEKLTKHRKTANELEEFAIEFVQQNIRKLI